MTLSVALGEVLRRHGISYDGGEQSSYVFTTQHLGSGNFGSVFAAYRNCGGGNWVRVAVKVISIDGVKSTNDLLCRVDWSGREGSFATSAAHPHIIAVYRPWYDVDSGVLYIPQELCDESLDNYRRRRVGSGIPSDILCSIFVQCLDILTALERAGVVHNDIKPQNLLLLWPSGRDVGAPCLKLADFGLSLSSYEIVDMTEPLPFGTPMYMAPEAYELSGACAPHARDMWSVACTMYELVTGRVPFHGASAEEVREKARRGCVAPFHGLSGMGPAELAVYHLATRLLKTNAQQRPSPDEVQRQLAQHLGPRLAPPPARVPLKCFRRFTACRPDVAVVVYRQPSAQERYATAHRFTYRDSNIFAEPMFVAEAAAPRCARTLGADEFPPLHSRPGDAAPSSRARSMPSLTPSGVLRRQASVPPPAPGASLWLRVVYPHEGFCQHTVDGRHILHDYDACLSSGCPPLRSAADPFSRIGPSRSEGLTQRRGVSVAPLVHFTELDEPAAGCDGVVYSRITAVPEPDSPLPIEPVRTGDSPVAVTPAKKSKSRLRAFFSRKSKSRG